MRRSLLTISICGLASIATAPAQAAFPGAPGPIVYAQGMASETESSGGLVAHGPRKNDGSRRLTEDNDDFSPSYSPNGRLIVFASNRDPSETRGQPHIYVMESDGSNVRQLTSGDFSDSNPSFSPNGRLVVFDRAEIGGRGGSQIFSVAVSGGEPHQISDDAGNDSDPTFTPNGKRIVFVSDRQSSARSDRSNIFSMRPDGSRIQLLIGGTRLEYEPDVSPDGRRVAFVSNRDHGPNIFIARIDGRRVRKLTNSHGSCFRTFCFSSPSWSPDGRHIAFHESGRYSSSVEVMRADGRGFAKDFAHGGTEEEGYGSYVGAPSWGPRPR
ncbi:MAG TPA: DPP IV N-terminal domain-containing protein [Solirubrobacterales bacterium]